MQRPFVYINMAMTADGKITSAGREYPRFSSTSDRLRMDRLRAEADAILVGAGTMRADNPTWHVRDPRMQVYRKSLGKQQGLIKLLVSARLELDESSRFFEEHDGGDKILVTVEDAPADRLARLRRLTEIWQIGRRRVDLAGLLDRLKTRRVERLLVEGGGELNWGFVEQDLVDELYVTISPALLGGRDAPTLLEGSGLTMKQQRRLRLVDLDRDGDELYCRYRVER